MHQCPRLYGVHIISRKWSYFVLRALRQPLSFSDIKRELKFVTNHILSRELKQLQEEKVVVLHDSLYQLTPAGMTLLNAAEPLYTWGVRHQGLRECPPELACSRCLHYPTVVQKHKA